MGGSAAGIGGGSARVRGHSRRVLFESGISPRGRGLLFKRDSEAEPWAVRLRASTNDASAATPELPHQSRNYGLRSYHNKEPPPALRKPLCASSVEPSKRNRPAADGIDSKMAYYYCSLVFTRTGRMGPRHACASQQMSEHPHAAIVQTRSVIDRQPTKAGKKA